MAVRDESKIYEFVMGFIASSDKQRRQYIERWREVLANFIVEPMDYGGESPYRRQGRVNSPYRSRSTSRHQVLLKDPQTHKVILTYASKLVRILFNDPDMGYIKAKPRGWEDAAQKAPTVSAYLRYVLGLPGHFRTFVEGIMDMMLFGTSVIEVNHHYEEREMLTRTVESDMGIETESFTRMRIPVYDDVKLTAIDPVDFYPDPSRYRIQDMAGAAKRFRMNALDARAMADKGLYDREAVDRAVRNLGKQSTAPDKENFRAGLDQPSDRIGHSDFREMVGYDYAGQLPWADDAGSSRYVCTVLNNVVVRSEPWPWADPALPWHTLIINPLQGRFYGVSPAEVIRWDQDFADAVKMLLATAIIRQVHPPLAVDTEFDGDVDGINAWKADSVLRVKGGPSGVGTLRYDANVQNGFAMLSGLKGSMEEASGAVSGITGEAGPDREAASVGVQRVQMAMDRPELAAMVLERECLPPIGQSILRRGQQFLDTEGLRQRIGELPESVWIGDIMGDYDIAFVGSRLEMTRQEKLQAYDRMIAMSAAVPQLVATIPWDQLGQEFVGTVLDLPEVAAKMADPQVMLRNILLGQVMGQQGQGGPAQNGVPQGAEPPGMLPAQAGGGPIPA